uniref:Transposase IS200 like n=1 Tax=Candidatus Kentrum sp. FM TaxID=2126340 RepID=A0A450TC19_9GAMM|nr:MAG: Transposase IS200 like [Candidatus Kentron sp. FM]VFJ64855.1 MAG: Transposase IS200 like [Candidatus Kentron sp. FM]VFK15337.1 MAG: Transposase IS200 like [Candidatus Kentron sp. FM]
MSQSLSSVYVHWVFSVKNREPFLGDARIRGEMHAFLGGVAKRLECPSIIVGGTEDHVHLLCRLGRTVSQADYVKELKRVSAIWVKKRTPTLGCVDISPRNRPNQLISRGFLRRSRFLITS